MTPNDWPPFPDSIAGMVASGLALTLRRAMIVAVFPGHFDADGPDPLTRIDALSNHLLSEAKNISTHGVPDSEDAAGITVVLQFIEAFANEIRRAIK